MTLYSLINLDQIFYQKRSKNIYILSFFKTWAFQSCGWENHEAAPTLKGCCED